MSQKQQERVGRGLAPILAETPIPAEAPIPAEEREMEVVQTEPLTPVSSTDPTSPTVPSTPVVEDVVMPVVQEPQVSGDEQPTGATPQKKSRKRKTKWVSVEEVSPKPSPWPLVLTLSICVLLMGIMIHPIVIGVGAILVLASVMGWMLERR